MSRYQEFLNTLLADLDELPVFVTENTKEYYDSYYLDALESGKTEDDILLGLGDPESISSQIKLDYYLYQPKQARKVFKGLFKNVFVKGTASTGKFLLAIVTYVFAVLLYLMQLLLKIGSIAVLGSGLYMIYTDYGVLFNHQTLAILFTSVLALSFLMLSSILFEWLSFLLRKATVNILRHDFKKLKQPLPKRFKPGLVVYAFVFVVSIIGLFTSPVYQDLTNIWMSNEPSEYTVVEEAFAMTDIHTLFLDVEHTNISISYSDVDNIQVYYEKPSYFDFNYSTHDGVLRIQETGNNEIPYLEFFVRHEGTLDLNIVLPEDIDLDLIQVKSIGSNMVIEVREVTLDIDTSTSVISLDYIGEYDFEIDTINGTIYVDNLIVNDHFTDDSKPYTIAINGVSTVADITKITD